MHKDIIFFIFFISAQDGIISSAELNKAKELLNIYASNLGINTIADDDFDVILEEFFESDSQFDECFDKVKNNNIELVLHITRLAATSDGLDIRENIAFDRALKYAGYSYDDIEKWERLFS
tara:strand:- start:260 stop:622 length:363 start_codon:yes stop_codon:yes gene_type:complete